MYIIIIYIYTHSLPTSVTYQANLLQRRPGVVAATKFKAVLSSRELSRSQSLDGLTVHVGWIHVIKYV